MSLQEAYLLVCDYCGQTRIYDADGYAPQAVLDDAATHKGWSVHLTQAHCVDCPPLCQKCGFEMESDTCEICDDDGQG